MLARTSPVSTAHDTLAPSHDVVFVDVSQRFTQVSFGVPLHFFVC